MIGCNKGLVSFIKEQNETLMLRTLGEDLREVLDQGFQIVNFTKTRPVKSCLFELTGTNIESTMTASFTH